MESTFLFLVLVLVTNASAFLDQSIPSDKLEFTTSKSEIQDGENDPLFLTCTFKPSENPHVAQLLSLKLSKKHMASGDLAFTELTMLTTTQLMDADDFTGTTTGQIVNDGSDSVLKVEFVHPTEAERAVYTCQAAGLDGNGMVVGSETSLRVGPADFEEVYSCLKEAWRPSMTHAKRSLIQCGATEDDWFQMLRNITVRKANDIPTSNIYGISDIFDNNSFYIFTTYIMTLKHGVEKCQEHNGYLTEINTEGEFLFLKGAMETLRVTQRYKTKLFFLVTGASFQTVGGDFEFDTHPDAPMYLGHWQNNYPMKNDLEYNGLKIEVRNGAFKMMNGGRYASSYLCEVSKDDV